MLLAFSGQQEPGQSPGGGKPCLGARHRPLQTPEYTTPYDINSDREYNMPGKTWGVLPCLSSWAFRVLAKIFRRVPAMGKCPTPIAAKLNSC